MEESPFLKGGVDGGQAMRNERLREDNHAY